MEVMMNGEVVKMEEVGRNVLVNGSVLEDGNIVFEVVSMGEFGWIDVFLDNVKFEMSGCSKEVVLKGFKEWVDDEKEKGKEVGEDYLKELDDIWLKFEKLMEGVLGEDDEVYDEGEWVVVMGGVWGVEYDSNYGVLLKRMGDKEE